jgi:hypothetical protein
MWADDERAHRFIVLVLDDDATVPGRRRSCATAPAPNVIASRIERERRSRQVRTAYTPWGRR